MKPFAAIAAVAFAVGLPVVVGAPHQQRRDYDPACIEVGGISMWGITGYNHIVFLTSRCQPTLVCVVSSDVTPEPREATVPGNTTVSVFLAYNSPAPFFHPNVSCEQVSQ